MAHTRKDIALSINKKLELRDSVMVNKVIEAFCDEVFELMYENQVVQLNNLGRFQILLKDNLRDPRTNEVLPPRWIPKFTFSKSFREKIVSKPADYFINEKKKEDEDKNPS